MKKIFIIIALSIIFASCKNKIKPNETNSTKETNIITLTPAQFKNAGIETGQLQQKSLSTILKVNGKIDVPPQNMVSISVPLGGYLKTTKLLPGMHVSKGEVIGVVEDQLYIQLQQDYLTAKAKLQYAQQDYERQKELNTTKANSDRVFQQATVELKSLEIVISALSEKLKLVGLNVASISTSNISRSINIYAPINGFVTKVNVNIGKYVSPTDVLFELVNPSDIHLALKIYEKDLDKLFIGQKLVAFTNNNTAKKHTCEILLIGKDLTTERSTDVHCHFEDYDKTLIPGTYMNAEIEVKSNNTLALNEDAIVRFEAKQYIFLSNKENSFEMTEVETGTTENGFTEIKNANNFINKNIVTKGAYNLLMSFKNKSEE
ncbi:MAG: efflux RND transporter periplasmic adaptor subunit [Bacteroidetes bacterium]|nr:efflux RND transporter periplasmic adaptor subunit [Bacteroidota bacterium]